MKLSTLILCLLSTCLSLSGEAVTVKMIPVTGEKFVGQWYEPDSDKTTTKPVILLLGGSEGGTPKPEPFLTENGYSVLALAYFKERGLPQTLQMVPLEYFDSAIQWIQKHPRTASRPLVVMGGSKGAELALLLASKKAEIDAVIAISPSSVVWDGLPKSFWPPQPKSSWSERNKGVPFVPYDYTQPFDPSDPLAIFKFYERSLQQTAAVQKASIQVENIKGPILLVSGADDQLWPSSKMAEDICERLKHNQFSRPYRHLKYADAGHTINEMFIMGGTQDGNRKARLDLRDKLIGFLNEIGKSETTRLK